MSDPQTVPGTSTTSPATANSKPPRSGRAGKVAFVIALVSVVLTWITMFAAPAAARRAVARGDYDNVFTFAAIAWGIVVALDLVALVLGTIGARQPTGKVRSGAAIAIGATGVLTVIVNIVGSNIIMPLIG